MECTEWAGFLLPPHSLTSFEIKKYYQNKPRFKGVYSQNNLPNTMKDEALRNKS